MGGMDMNISQDNKVWKFPHYEVGEAIDWELLTQKFACLSDMKGVVQDSLWHSEGDVYTHTKMVVEALVKLEEYQNLSEQKQHILFASAIFHDIEKRSTTKREIIEGVERVVSPSHAKKGEHTVRSMLYREIETPFEVREEIVKLIRHHGVPLFILENEKPQRKAIQVSLILDTSLLYLLAKADVLGRICIDKANILENIELFKELCLEYECFGRPRAFSSDYARFFYLNREDSLPEYEPYDDLKFTVYLMSAIPASGKDTYIKKHLDLPILSLDNIRRTHKIKPTDKKGTGRVVQMAKEQAKVYMRDKQSFVFNATNITKDMRARWISLFLDYKARVEIIYLEVPYKQLKKQNANRDYIVPLKVIDKLFDKIEIPCFDEGHGVKKVIKNL
jgi:predicted kinase